MFCTQCGHDVDDHDKFCGNCGKPVALSASATGSAAEDWRNSNDYRTVLHHPEVEELIAAATGKNPGGMSADEFFSKAQPLLDVAGVGTPMSVVAEIAQPLYARLGVATGKDDEAQFAEPAGRVMAAVLCSMASRGQSLASAEQAADGCAFTATLPSSIWAFGGKLVVTIQSGGSATRVLAATSIPGQKFDWGHSKRLLKSLFGDIPNFLSLQP